MPLVVSYSTGGGNAAPDVDYVAVAATNITFLAGSTSQNVTLQLIGDTLLEGDESFGASFQLIYNDTVQSTAAANITILDDDVSATAPRRGWQMGRQASDPQEDPLLAGAGNCPCLTCNRVPALLTPPVAGQPRATQPVCLGGWPRQHDHGVLQHQRQWRAGEACNTRLLHGWGWW